MGTTGPGTRMTCGKATHARSTWSAAATLDEPLATTDVACPEAEATAHHLLEQHVVQEDDARYVPAVDVDICGYEVDLAALVDMMLIADEEAHPLSYVLDRLAHQQMFVDLANNLEDMFPDHYAGASAEPDAYRICFSGPPPPQALAMIDELPVEVGIVGSRGLPEEERLTVRYGVVESIHILTTNWAAGCD